MEYAQSETFIVLSETENITRTAEILYKTQPAISSRIQALEEELGFTLIYRTKGKKNITLTPKGKGFLATAEKLVALYGELEAAKETLSTSLTVSSIASIGAPLITDICKSMIAEEGTRISLLTYQTEDAYRMVAQKEVDIAFVARSKEVQGVKCEPVFSQSYYVAIGCEHPGPITEISPDRLDRTMEILQIWNDAFKLWHDNWFGEDNYHIRVDSYALLKEFLKIPGYWAIVQEHSLSELQGSIPVQICRLTDQPPQRICYMLTNRYPDKVNLKILRKFKEKVYAYAQKKQLMTR